MKHLKILCIAALTTAALLAVVGSAAATTVTSPTGTTYTGTLKGVSTGHGILHNPIAKIECNVTLEGKIESHGVGVTAKGKATTFTIGPCTNSWHVTTVATGEVEAHWTSGYNGTITSNGATVATTRFGVECRYATSNTKLATVTGGIEPSMHMEAAIPFHGGSSLCGSGTTQMTGSGKLTSPTSAYLDA
jgi:hypothetical protein